jgi:uncharacterized protein
MEIITSILRESAYLWLEISPYLLFGIFFAGLLHIFLGKGFIYRHLGRGGLLSIVKATLFGIPLPVCSCGVIPLAAGLRKDGAHKSSVLSFLVSTPTTGVDSIAATYSLLGPLFTLFRFLGSFICGLAVGFFDYIFEGRLEKTVPRPLHKHPAAGNTFRLKRLLLYSFIEIPRDIGKWLIFGTFLGGAIAALIPADLFMNYLSFPRDFLVAIMLGVPLYVCATGSIPIAVSLIAKGFSPGAGLVFLIVGPATNAITLSFVRTKLGRRSFYIYLISIVTVAAMLGLVFNYLWQGFALKGSLLAGGGQMLPFSAKRLSAIALLIIIGAAVLRKQKPAFAADLVVSVPDIHCAHCRISLEGYLKKIGAVDAVRVDEDKKTISVEGKASRQAILKAIREAGYHPAE